MQKAFFQILLNNKDLKYINRLKWFLFASFSKIRLNENRLGN